MGLILGACFDDEYMPNLEHLMNHNSRGCKIYGRGDNRDGHLSNDDDHFAANSWQRITELENMLIKKSKFRNLYIGFESISILNNLNEIYVAGNNDKYKLGIMTPSDDENKSHDTDSKIAHFQKLPFNNKENGNPILLSKGIYSKQHSFIYTDSNKLFANGRNWVGEFGNAPKQNQNDEIGDILQQIPEFWTNAEKIREIHCGSHFSLFLTHINNLYGVGYHTSVGSNDHISKPILLYDNIIYIETGINHSLLMDINNKLIIHGTDTRSAEITQPTTKQNIQSFFNDNENLEIKSIHSGYRHGMIIINNINTKQNECYTFGNNQNGQIGDGNMNKDGDKIVTKPYLVIFKDRDKNEYVIQGSSGGNHNVLLTNKNNIFTFGSNWSKKCGNDIFPPVYDVDEPHFIDKQKDLKLNQTDKIEMVIATNNATLIVVA